MRFMRLTFHILPLKAVFVSLLIGTFAGHANRSAAKNGLGAQLSLRLLFIENQGQAAPGIRYIGKGQLLTAYFAGSEIRIQSHGIMLQLSFPGSNPAPQIEALDKLPNKANFLVGSDPQGWKTNLSTYGAVIYRDLYPGIDMVYTGLGRRLKSEFRVAPRADPSLIRLRYSGVDRPSLDSSGALLLSQAGAELREEAPELYQERNGKRIPVQGAFQILPDGSVGFTVGLYDLSLPLVIDPVITNSTYLGGSGLDSATGIAVDAAGNAYVTGWTDSSDIPTTSAVQPRSGGGADVFVAKFNAAGQLVYCTYLGGSGDDRGFGIAVDGFGSAYVTGWTGSTDFPFTAARYQGLLGGPRDAFVAKLNAAGNALLYSTYFGGSGYDSGKSVAVDNAGNFYIAGDTSSTNLPIINPFQGTNQGLQDGFVAKFNASGSTLVYSTYLGGNGDDTVNGIAVDSAGSAYLTGGTKSSNFPTRGPVQPLSGGNQDAFITKLSPAGNALVYSTYLGGSGGTVGFSEAGLGIAVDASGNAYVAGTTSSANFPLANPLQPVGILGAGGSNDAFVTKLNPSGTALVYSTYLGGSGLDSATAIAVDAFGSAYVAGYTGSLDFPLANPSQSANLGAYDAFIAKLNPAGSALLESTYLGGSGADSANAIAVDSSGKVYVAGQTLSSNFPLRDAVQSFNGGGFGAFVTTFGASAGFGTNAKAAVFRAGQWLLDRNGNGSWDGPGIDLTFALGQAGDIPVTGDWNGSGTAKAGIFRDGLWVLDYNGNGVWEGPAVDRAFLLGQGGDIPVVGDWNGDGRVKAGIFRNGLWVLDYNGNGVWDGVIVDRAIYLGQARDIPVVGDWNGDGRAKAGIFRDGLWVLDYNGNGVWDGPAVDRAFLLGQAGDRPVVGDWNGSGTFKAGIFRAGLWVLDYNGNGIWDGTVIDRAVSLGLSGDTPLVGDWNGLGRSQIGVFRNATFFLDNGNFQWDGAPVDRVFVFGLAGDTPLIGRW